MLITVNFEHWSKGHESDLRTCLVPYFRIITWIFFRLINNY